MKKLLLLLPLMLLLSLSSMATSTAGAFQGGTLSVSGNALTLTGAELVSLGSMVGNLGTVMFTTGSLISGNFAQGATFSPGGSFDIDEGSTIVFNGTFNGNVIWNFLTLANGTHEYVLTGTLIGTLNGTAVQGVAVGLTIDVGKGFFNRSTQLASGVVNLTSTGVVPEPGTYAFGLLGVGFIGLSKMVQKRMVA